MSEIDLEFKDWTEKINGDLGKTEWLTCYLNKDSVEEELVFYCAFIKNEMVEQSLRDYGWEFSIGDGIPGFSSTNINGNWKTEYYRYSIDGIEPLIISRHFHNLRPGYKEVSEEFRHYFNLFFDDKTNKIIRFNEDGDEEDVVIYSENEIIVKLKYIKEFISVKEMSFALFFEFKRYSSQTLDELDLLETKKEIKNNNSICNLFIGPWQGLSDYSKKSFSMLMGKKLLFCIENYDPFTYNKERKKYQEFIIDLDENGKSVFYTCDEGQLSNYFGKNEGKPHYLTPVMFTKDVLSKYYSQPDKFTVEDGHLYCGGLWGLRMDNNHPDYVMVYLGDLGHLSEKEQSYWKHFNVSTKGTISHTAYSRGIEAKFTDPEKNDLYFKFRYKTFNEDWFKKMNWHLFKPLSEENSHHTKTLHIPLTENQNEFDDQVLSITKLMIDSLNDKELKKRITVDTTGMRSINKLEAFLLENNHKYLGLIEFLHNLYTLRSQGVAHLKGKSYQKIKDQFDIDKKPLSEVFNEILKQALMTLNTLENTYLKE